MNAADEGVRLAKRVAALQGCSRREAEALIAAGAVTVAGEVVTDPARRVTENQPVQVSAGPVTGAMTVLLYKPAGCRPPRPCGRPGPVWGGAPCPPQGFRNGCHCRTRSRACRSGPTSGPLCGA